MTRTDWTCLILLSCLWGGSFLFVERLVAELAPLTIVLGRVGLGTLVLMGALPVLGIPWPRGQNVWAALAVMGLLNNMIPFTLFAIAQGGISAGLAAIVNATTPLFTLLALRAFTGAPLGGLRLAGVAAGFGGVAIMMGAAATGGTQLAIVCCLLAAGSYGLAAVWGQRLRGMGVEPMQAAFGQIACSTALVLPLALLIDRPWTLAMPSPGAFGALVGVATLSTALAYLLYFRIVASAGAVAISLVTFLIPVSALAMGAALGGTLPQPHHLAGMALIALGLALIEKARRS